MAWAGIRHGSRHLFLKYKRGKKMPKIKTNRAAAKRFKKTGTGKFVFSKSHASHILTKKTTKRKRGLRQRQIIDKTNESKKDDNPRIYRLKWASGQNNVVSLNEAIETVNRWANQKDWGWIRIINTETNKQQIVYESATRIGRKLNKLNEDMLTAE